MGADGAVIQLVTRCASADEFVERFARFTTETDVIVPALPHVTVGTNGQFEICLKDRTVMMKGRCEVAEVFASGGTSGPRLMRLRVREMDAHSAGIHLRLMERHAASAKPPAVPVEVASQAVPTETATTADASVTVVDRPMPPPETVTTAAAPAPRPEARVPGAAFTLPANPLSDLDGADLAGFIEATLLEADGGVVAGPVGIGAQADRPPPVGAPPALAARLAALLDLARRNARRVGLFAACLLGGLLLGALLRQGSTAAPPVVRAPAPPAPVVEPPPSPALAAADEAPDPAPRDCLARVRTKPAGAAVFWGDIALGSSPIKQVAIPCGTATVTFRRDHYAEVSRTITAERGRNTVVAQRMRRAPAKVEATSSPRAPDKLNRRSAGSTPRTRLAAPRSAGAAGPLAAR